MSGPGNRRSVCRRSAARRRLNQHIEHLALVVDSTPEVHPLAGIRTTASSRRQRLLGRGRRRRSRRAITGPNFRTQIRRFRDMSSPRSARSSTTSRRLEREAQAEPCSVPDEPEESGDGRMRFSAIETAYSRRLSSAIPLS
jgi:hypothetical protein